MTKAEAQFLSGLYERNHRLCALYILVRNLVKWPLEILVVLPIAVVVCTCIDFLKGIVRFVGSFVGSIVFTIYEEILHFGRDWRAVYLAWIGKDKKESGGTNGNK